MKKMKSRVIKLGVVGVDSGQLMMCDPAYLSSEYNNEIREISGHDILRHEDGSLWQFSYDRKTTSRADVKPFPGTYETIIPQYGKTPNQMVGLGEMEQSGIDPLAEIPDGEFSYDGIRKLTLKSENQGGQLNYKMGHAGAGVCFSSGMGDGVYNVMALLVDTDEYGERIAAVWVDLDIDKGVNILDILSGKKPKPTPKKKSGYLIDHLKDGVVLTHTMPENHFLLGGRTGHIKITYDELVDMLGKPNANPKGEERDGKVKARWYIGDTVSGEEFCIWSYKYDRPSDCTAWSCGGSHRLLRAVFGSKFIQ